MVNSASDKTEYSGGNFAIKNAANMYCEIAISRTRLTIPTVSDQAQVYSGSGLKFRLNGYNDTDWEEVATLSLPEGVTLERGEGDDWFLVATDAGTYTVTASLKTDKKSDWCWNTADGIETLDDRVLTFTVSRKTLFVDFLSTTGVFFMQKNAAVSFSVEPLNVVDGDEVKIALQYYSSEDGSVAITVSSGVLDASTLESGSYRLEAVLNDNATGGADNKNYVLDTSGSFQNFTISAKNVNIETITWQYTQNNGLPEILSGGDSATNYATVKYNGSTFVISVAEKSETLAGYGVKVDTTFGVNGYENGLLTDAIDTPVAVKVRLVPYNEEYAFNVDGNPAEEQFADYTIYVKVEKADVDFSAIDWSAEELEYNGLNQSVSIISGLPSFLNVTYSTEATAWNIGDYTARVIGLTIKESEREASKNYNVPTDYSQIAPHNWSIVPKKIPVTWVMSRQQGQGEIIFVPTLADNSSPALEYIYYAADAADEAVPDTSAELTLEQVSQNYDQTTYKTYYVCARLKAPQPGEDRAFSSANCILVLGSGQEVTETYQSFQIGGNKNPVRVSLRTDKTVYNGSSQPAEVFVDAGGLTVEHNIYYKEKVETEGEGGEITVTFVRMSGEPIDAGEYKVVVEISKEQSGSFAISGERELAYVIEKADFDLTGMKWVDTENDNAEYTAPYEYNPNSTHTVAYVGETIEGLTVSCHAVSGTEADIYTSTVTFAYENESLYGANYNLPENIEFEWVIEKCAPDLSGVVWNYNDEPFVFTVKDGEPVKFGARLVFPEGYEHMQSLIVYEGHNELYSDAGFYNTSFKLTENEEILKNYGDINFSPLLESQLAWEIAPLRIPKAKNLQDYYFKAEGYGFGEVTNLPEDFEQYFTVKVLDKQNSDVPKEGGVWNFVNVGSYRIQIMFKQGMNKSNGGKVDNVKWADNSRSPYQVTVNIAKLVFETREWIKGEGIDKPALDADDLEGIEKYFDYVLKKQATDEEISYDSILEFSTYYTIALKLKEGFAGNVAIKYNSGTESEETVPFLFQTEDPFAIPPENFIPPLTEAELKVRYRHTGNEITFEFGSWFLVSEMEIISGELKGTDVGNYEVTVGFMPGSTYAWGTSIDDCNRNPVTVTFEIYEDDTIGKFILTAEAEAANRLTFQYEDFSLLQGNIKEYVYTTENVLYIARLAYEDTLAQLLAQFQFSERITVYGADNVKISEMTNVLATGMTLRLEQDGVLLNQLTISVLGDVDGDGDVTTVDKAQLNAYTLGTLDLTGAKLLAGDIDGDSDITTIDKAKLNAYTLGSLDLYSSIALPVLPSPTAEPQSVQVEDVEEIPAVILADEKVEFTKPLSEAEEGRDETAPELPSAEKASALAVLPARRELLGRNFCAVCAKAKFNFFASQKN